MLDKEYILEKKSVFAGQKPLFIEQVLVENAADVVGQGKREESTIPVPDFTKTNTIKLNKNVFAILAQICLDNEIKDKEDLIRFMVMHHIRYNGVYRMSNKKRREYLEKRKRGLTNLIKRIERDNEDFYFIEPVDGRTTIAVCDDTVKMFERIIKEKTYNDCISLLIAVYMERFLKRENIGHFAWPLLSLVDGLQ